MNNECEGGLKSSCDDVINTFDDFFINEMQALKCMNRKWNNVEKSTSFGFIP